MDLRATIRSQIAEALREMEMSFPSSERYAAAAQAVQALAFALDAINRDDAR